MNNKVKLGRLKRLDYELETIMASIEYKLWLLHISNNPRVQK